MPHVLNLYAIFLYDRLITIKGSVWGAVFPGDNIILVVFRLSDCGRWCQYAILCPRFATRVQAMRIHYKMLLSAIN